MIKTIVRLQLALQKGALSQGGLGVLGFIAGYAFSILVAVGFLVAGIALRFETTLVGPVLVIVWGGGILVWSVGSILFGNGSSTLDASRLALLPLNQLRLGVALVIASLFSPAGVMTLGVVAAALVTISSLGVGVVTLMAAALFLFTSITAGRLATSMMSQLFRGRKTREIAGLIAAVLAMTVGFLGQAVGLVAEFIDQELVEAVPAVVAWTPFGWTGRSIDAAQQGDWFEALLSLAAAAVLASGLAIAWARVLARLQSATEASSTSEVEGSLTPGLLRHLPDKPSSAIAARELRMIRRDPRLWRQMAGFLPMALVLALPAGALFDDDPRAPLLVAVFGLTAGFATFNLFGADGRAAATDLMVVNDVRTLFKGKHIAWFLVLFPVMVLTVVGLGIYSRGWLFIVPGLMTSVSAFLISIGVGSIMSVTAPMTLPEGMGWGGANTGQGFAVAIAGIVGLLAAVILAIIPIGALALTAVTAEWAVYPVAIAALGYGWIIRRFTMSMAVAKMQDQRPEFLAKLV